MNKASSLFTKREYFVAPKYQTVAIIPEYLIYDADQKQLGKIKHTRGKWKNFLRFFVKSKLLGLTLHVLDMQERTLLTFRRRPTIFSSTISISDGNGRTLGYLKQKFYLLKPKIEIFDTNKNIVAQIKGDWKAWKFTITDAAGNEIGLINRKWANAIKDVLNTQDQYRVELTYETDNENHRRLVVGSALALGIILREDE